MEEKLMSMEEIRNQVNQDKQPNNLAVQETQSKSITDVSISDVKFKLNTDKSYAEQTEDIVNAMATVKAVQNEETAQELADKKSAELRKKAEAKATEAETAQLKAETERQLARRKLYEAVLNDFMITKHLPQWLMIIIVAILSPIYLAKVLVLCVPLGFVRTLMDCVDNIFIRYEEVDGRNKQKVRVTVWILLGAIILGAIALIVLKAIGQI